MIPTKQPFHLHATPIKSLSRQLKENVNSNTNSRPDSRPDSTKRSLVKQYKIDQLVSQIKLKQSAEDSLLQTKSENTLIEELCKNNLQLGFKHKQHLHDADKIADIGKLINKLKLEAAIEEKMQLVQTILSKICSLQDQSENLVDISKPLFQQESANSQSQFMDIMNVVPQVKIAPIRQDDIQRILDKVVKKQHRSKIDLKAVRARVNQLSRVNSHRKN